MSDGIKTAGCTGGILLVLILLVLMTGAVVSLVQTVRGAGAQQYLSVIAAISLIICLALVVSVIAQRPSD
jgi:Na+-driven multidrug efflux pump